MARERTRNPAGEGPGEGDEKTDKPRDRLDAELEKYVAAEGPTLGRGDALTKLAEANKGAKKADIRYCADRYDVGEILVEFAAKKGHHALGYTVLGLCFTERLGVGRTWAEESMRLAKSATRADIEGMEWAVAKLGLSLLTLLELKSFGDLKKVRLPVLTPDGEVAHFPERPEILEAAIKEIERQRAEPKEEVDPKRIERAAENAANEILERYFEKHPDIKAAFPKVFIRGGVANFRAETMVLRSETFSAMVRMLAEVDKALKKL